MSKKYNVEFKRDAVNHLIVSGKSIKSVAESLGISKSALGQWKLDYQEKATHEELSKDKEIKSLRDTNKDLQMQCEILKKAMAIFSQTQK